MFRPCAVLKDGSSHADQVCFLFRQEFLCRFNFGNPSGKDHGNGHSALDGLAEGSKITLPDEAGGVYPTNPPEM